MSIHRLLGLLVIIVVVGVGFGLASWKHKSIEEANAASAQLPEPMESVGAAIVKERKHTQTTTSIGTITALRSVTLQNEVAGTVRQVNLIDGRIVEAGTMLVTLDVSVEQAELREQEARATLAETLLNRIEAIGDSRAISKTEVDRARGELDVAKAQVVRTKAVIDRKIIRAPFRSRVGISDVHPGQYLDEGTKLTTLQGVDEAVHVDFTVPQHVAATLKNGDVVQIFPTGESPSISATVVALDSRVDPSTRNATIRAKIQNAENAPVPGASVRVQVAVGDPIKAVSIPVSALRKGPTGDHVFVIQSDKDGKKRAYTRQVVSGAMLGDEILILKGLSPGQYVASSGSFKLRDSALVAMTNNAGASNKGH
jgi:membrane fusion protein (multidrug efflux system)